MKNIRAHSALALTAIVALTGCIRYDATWQLQEDNTVDGEIAIGVTQATIDDSEDGTTYKDFGLDADLVAANYSNATVNDLGEAEWDGERVTIVNEGLASFSGDPAEPYEIKVERIGDQFIVTGLDPAEIDETTKDAIIDGNGSAILQVTFPGEVIEHNGSLSGDNTTVTWNMATVDNAPYARGNAVAEAPESPVETEDPVETEAAVETAAPTDAESPSPSTAAEPADSTSGGEGVPTWIWAVIGVLAAALAGVIGFLIARSRSTS